MTTEVFHIGDGVELTAKFTNLAGVATDPTAVEVKVTEPDGATDSKVGTDSEVTNPNVGEYIRNFTAVLAGRHFVRWAGTGLVVAAQLGEFYVHPKGTS